MTDLLAPPATPPADPGWSLHWRGVTYHEDDLIGAHLSVLALITGTDDYESLSLDPRAGHQRLMFMLVAFVTVDAAGDLDDIDEVATKIAQAQKQVADASADEILAALKPA